MRRGEKRGNGVIRTHLCFLKQVSCAMGLKKRTSTLKPSTNDLKVLFGAVIAPTTAMMPPHLCKTREGQFEWEAPKRKRDQSA